MRKRNHTILNTNLYTNLQKILFDKEYYLIKEFYLIKNIYINKFRTINYIKIKYMYVVF